MASATAWLRTRADDASSVLWASLPLSPEMSCRVPVTALQNSPARFDVVNRVDRLEPGDDVIPSGWFKSFALDRRLRPARGRAYDKARYI